MKASDLSPKKKPKPFWTSLLVPAGMFFLLAAVYHSFATINPSPSPQTGPGPVQIPRTPVRAPTAAIPAGSPQPDFPHEWRSAAQTGRLSAVPDPIDYKMLIVGNDSIETYVLNSPPPIFPKNKGKTGPPMSGDSQANPPLRPGIRVIKHSVVPEGIEGLPIRSSVPQGAVPLRGQPNSYIK
jgi:hypothetical protein